MNPPLPFGHTFRANDITDEMKCRLAKEMLENCLDKIKDLKVGIRVAIKGTRIILTPERLEYSYGLPRT